MAFAANSVSRKGVIAGVSLEQAPVYRRKHAGTRPTEPCPALWSIKVRSSRNTIRVELSPTASLQPKPVQPLYRPQTTPPPAAPIAAIEPPSPGPTPGGFTAGDGDRARAQHTGASPDDDHADGKWPARHRQASPNRRTTLGGVVPDFPNVTSRAPAQSQCGQRAREQSPRWREAAGRRSSPVSSWRLARVSRITSNNRPRTETTSTIVFEPPQATGTILLAPGSESAPKIEPEPDISIQDAIADAEQPSRRRMRCLR